MTVPTPARRVLLALAALLGLWAACLWLTGGISTRVYGIRLSSTETVRPLAFALVFALAYGAAAGREVRADVAWLLEGLRSRATLLAALVAIGGSVVAVTWGSHAASGADSYGYVSQAGLWRRGELVIRQPLMTELRLPANGLALAPHGYRPGRVRGTIVPTYAPGLPLVMATASALFGACALYLVIPAFTLLLIWATYLLGRTAAGPPEGLACAVIVASSAIVLRMSMLPMTDVPAAGAWTAALALAAGALRPGASPGVGRVCRLAAAGAFTALTILIRPNLVLLGGVITVALVARLRQPGETLRALIPSLAAYAIVGAIGGLAIAGVNAYLYGSPLQSGYGTGFFSLAHIGPNLSRYPRWLVYSQTPVVVLAVIPLLGRWLTPQLSLHSGSGILLYGTILVMFVSYAPFLVFDEWWYLRYLLPAIPAITVCTIVGGRWILQRVAGRRMSLVATACVITLVAINVRLALREDVFHLRTLEQRYIWVANYVRDHTPEKTAIICMQHSGSIRYYAGRVTLRFDVLDNLDSVIEQLRHLGYKVYIVLEDWERKPFRARFAGTSALGTLDWVPAAELKQPVLIGVFDPDVRLFPGEQATIPRTAPPCDPSPLASTRSAGPG